MPTLLIKNAHAIATFNDEGSELRDAYVFARDGFIETVGPSLDAPLTADEVIDASNCVVIPGLVHTHHQMYQTLNRAIPRPAGRRAFYVAQGSVPDLGVHDPGHDPHVRAHCNG